MAPRPIRLDDTQPGSAARADRGAGVMEEAALGDPGGDAEVVHRRRRVALGANQMPRSVEQPGSGTLRGGVRGGGSLLAHFFSPYRLLVR